MKLPDGKLKRFDLDFDPLPTRAQWEERAKKPGIVGYHAKKNLARMDRGEKLPVKLPYSVATWTFGDDLAMVFLPGEVVIDYQRRLKREFDDARLWVNGYANDVPCYIPSRRILAEGGYEAEDSLWYYDRPARLATSSEDRIIKAVHDLMPKKFVAKTNRADVPQPLSPKQALNSMRVASEFVVDLVAAEPLVVDPVAIDWGADGKLWVAEMRDYPMGIDGKWKPGGAVKFLEDNNGDGHYDKATLFLDKLPFPTGVFAWRKGVLICAAPDIIYAEDTNRDGRADVVRKIFTGFETNNYQARVNSLSLGLDGWVYGANGLLGGKIRFVGGTSSTSPTLYGDSRSSSLQGALDIRGRDFRMNPDTGAFEPASGLTQQGRVRDDFGNWFGCDNSHSLWHYPLAEEYVRRNPHVAAPNPAVHVPLGRDWNQLFPASKTLERFNDAGHANRITSACGLEIYRDELLGKEFYGNAFVCEPVHNLVHRQVLRPDGVTFRSTRATNEVNREFLSSTDNWFRPAQVRTGPDGALWVVDMYRHVIEHPRWIPSNRLAQLDVRAGADKGRIYRVYRKDTPPRPLQNFAKLPTEQLAGKLDSPNGTERDIVHRELLNRGDKAAAPKLREIAMQSSRAAARIQALGAWDSLVGITLTEAIDFLRKESVARDRVALLRLDKQTLNPSVILSLLHDSDERVRFQAVLATHGRDGIGHQFVHLLPEAATNRWMRAALLSSASTCAGQLLALAPKLIEQTNAQELFRGLLATAVATGTPADLANAVAALLPTDETQATSTRLDALAMLAKRLPESSWDSPQLATLLQLTRNVVTNTQHDLAVRRAALEFVSAAPASRESLEWFRPWLKPNPLQSAAVSALLQTTNASVPEFLFTEWPGFSPGDRTRIVERLATRPGGIGALLAAVESKTVSTMEVPLELRNRLVSSKEAALRDKAERLWPRRVSNRAHVVAEYRNALTASGGPERGALVFNDNCATCHQLGGKGTAVGPDLTPWRDKGVEDFLVALLDPNAAIEPRYVNYLVQTKTGNLYYGVIRAETATSIELAAPGIHETLLRTDAASIQALPTSLMPEGLEQNISTAQMNDLIAYLRQPGPRPFGSATRDQIASARTEFIAQRPLGRALLIEASEQLDYPSWMGRLPLWHCRQTDGKSRVMWQSPVSSPRDGTVEYVVPAALGFASQPSGAFTLKANGKAVIDFNVALNDTEWTSADGKVHLSYRVMEANSEDSNGLLHLRLAPEFVNEKGPVTFEVVGSAANSQRWFGVYDTKLIARPQAKSSAQ